LNIGGEHYLGQEFDEDESRPGGPKLVILSYGLWQSLFHSDPNVVGEPVDVKGEPYTIVGVLPQDAMTPSSAELRDPLQPDEGGACSGFDCGILLRLDP
jgi:MacB-like periplasmic core domain